MSDKMTDAEARAKAERDRPIIAKLTLALTDRTTIEQLSASGEGARRVRLPGMLARQARAAEEREARELAEQMEKEANTKGEDGKEVKGDDGDETKEEKKGDEGKAEEQQTSG
jgi:hypothetical protein